MIIVLVFRAVCLSQLYLHLFRIRTPSPPPVGRAAAAVAVHGGSVACTEKLGFEFENAPPLTHTGCAGENLARRADNCN